MSCLSLTCRGLSELQWLLFSTVGEFGNGSVGHRSFPQTKLPPTFLNVLAFLYYSDSTTRRVWDFLSLSLCTKLGPSLHSKQSPPITTMKNVHRNREQSLNASFCIDQWFFEWDWRREKQHFVLPCDYHCNIEQILGAQLGCARVRWKACNALVFIKQ